ncbi:MAG: phasin family protein [Rhodanobacteraceae bacterium]|nr:phasin family protein [Rhodanobacteraceae bacterium]
MYEQASNQFLALSKQAAETFIKANAIAVEGFEKLIDIQLKTIEDRVKVATDLMGQAGEVKDFDAARASFPKSVNLVKDSAEKFYATSQEVTSVLVKTGEAYGQLFKGTVEAANDSVVKATKAAKAR